MISTNQNYGLLRYHSENNYANHVKELEKKLTKTKEQNDSTGILLTFCRKSNTQSKYPYTQGQYFKVLKIANLIHFIGIPLFFLLGVHPLI